MHLFLIRHGETEHNVAGLLAGVTDSRLTNHGVTQTQRLGTGLVKDRSLRFTNVYASDLQRAYMTADEICKAQNSTQSSNSKIEVVKLHLLREVDFGSLELVAWSSRRVEEPSNEENFKPKETADSMQDRANTFLDDYIVPLLAFDDEEAATIAIVSHGIFLGHLWRTLLSRLKPKSVRVDPSIASTGTYQTIERMSWSNTGFLEVKIQVGHPENDKKNTLGNGTDDTVTSTPFSNAILRILSFNDKRHLLNLKRARGGIGSSAHDQRQQNLNTFFRSKKLKTTTGSIKSKPLVSANSAEAIIASEPADNQPVGTASKVNSADPKKTKPP